MTTSAKVRFSAGTSKGHIYFDLYTVDDYAEGPLYRAAIAAVDEAFTARTPLGFGDIYRTHHYPGNGGCDGRHIDHLLAAFDRHGVPYDRMQAMTCLSRSGQDPPFPRSVEFAGERVGWRSGY